MVTGFGDKTAEPQSFEGPVRVENGSGQYFKLPCLTTTQRDALAGEAGKFIFNTTVGRFQGRDASAWRTLESAELTNVFDATIAAGDDHSSGILGVSDVIDDYGTLINSQEYKAMYARYNIRSTTPGNPSCEVTGVEGVAASYAAFSSNTVTMRGGLFRTYIDANATYKAKTSVGCEVSARASYSGGTECVADSGTAFVGMRIWMAPYFTDASITNINNFHALWIVNEAPSKVITHAIKIDVSTYQGGFNYALYSDDGKVYINLDGTTGSSFASGGSSTASGDTLLHVLADDYRTLSQSQEYKGAYIRYNVRGSIQALTNEITGVEGVVGIYSAPSDNSVTVRGGYFRNYVDANATYRARTLIGCEISSRASYSGGTECVADSGTAFVGARIWMAPYFTDASFANITNSHALWIISETPNGGSWGKYIDRAITIDATTYDSGFNYCFYADSGKFYIHLDGSEAGSGLVAGERSTASGDTWFTLQVDDYRTLTSSQEFKGGYFRYNVRSTTPSNPSCEVTGLEGVAASYAAFSSNTVTLRGGYFRTYIDANATYKAKTNVGCEISARASYSGGTECVADSGTAFVGARIWMAPYFTDASISNINNSHALWIVNETPNGGSWAKYVDSAITIDATTYDSGFNYCFKTDSGKFYMVLDGSEAGSGLVAGERSTASGDTWFTMQIDDYRTLTTSQVYTGGYFRYNIRSTTPSNPSCEVTGLEGVAASYAAFSSNTVTMRGGYFRTYIDADATYKAKTNIGCEMSARASYSGGTACVADSGTAFVGARIWMAPFFTGGSVGNINNFWGLWIYGEHSSQRNADAAIFINDNGGGFTDGIRLGMTFTGYAINIDVDGKAIAMGASQDAVFAWDTTADEKHCLKLNLPAVSGNDVPVFMIGTGIIGSDVGPSGWEVPSLLISNTANDAYLAICSGDVASDYPALYFVPAADEDVLIIYIQVSGDPSLNWDETADAFVFSPNVDCGSNCEADAYTVGGVAGVDFNGVVTNLTVAKGIVTAAS